MLLSTLRFLPWTVTAELCRMSTFLTLSSAGFMVAFWKHDKAWEEKSNC
jgi:hypothetical protein